MVKIKLYGMARQIAAKEELDINLEGPISLKMLMCVIHRHRFIRLTSKSTL